MEISGLPEVISTVIKQLLETSVWEITAVLLAIAYLLLALRQNSWCWYCAFVSTVIYTLLFWDVSLLMQAVLNLYYMVMAVYGWQQWRRGGPEHRGLAIRRWPLGKHLVAVTSVALLTLISGALLANNTLATLPYVDSFTMWGSVLTTWMVAKKIIENWLYWVVIDGVSIVLYVNTGMYLTALLFASYVIIVIFGYLSWRKHMDPAHVAV